MAEIRQYLLSIIASAIICAVIINITGKTGVIPSIIKLLTGLFIVYTVISPWTKIHLIDLTDYFSDLKQDGSEIVAEGKEYAAYASCALIKEQLEAYILDKAKSMDLTISVEVVMDAIDSRLPSQINISGSVSPYDKQRLIQIIADELGIPKENQSWT